MRKLNPININPRYLAWCVFNGSNTTSEQLQKDKITWPGGTMTGYILWIKEMGIEFCHLNGFSYDYISGEKNSILFQEYLLNKYPIDKIIS